jgi:hypothetical protein
MAMARTVKARVPMAKPAIVQATTHQAAILPVEMATSEML